MSLYEVPHKRPALTLLPWGMSRNAPFVWNAKREQAAELVAAGRLTPAEIAAQLRITRRQLLLWREHPVFGDRVVAHIAAARVSSPPDPAP